MVCGSYGMCGPAAVWTLASCLCRWRSRCAFGPPHVPLPTLPAASTNTVEVIDGSDSPVFIPATWWREQRGCSFRDLQPDDCAGMTAFASFCATA